MNYFQTKLVDVFNFSSFEWQKWGLMLIFDKPSFVHIRTVSIQIRTKKIKNTSSKLLYTIDNQHIKILAHPLS